MFCSQEAQLAKERARKAAEAEAARLQAEEEARLAAEEEAARVPVRWSCRYPKSRTIFVPRGGLL